MQDRRKNRILVLMSAVILLLLTGFLFVRRCESGAEEVVVGDSEVEVIEEIEEVIEEEMTEDSEESEEIEEKELVEIEIETEEGRQTEDEEIAFETEIEMEEVIEVEEKIEREKYVVVEEKEEDVEKVEEEKIIEKDIIEETEIEDAEEDAEEDADFEGDRYAGRAVMALKTNLLWDLALAPNIEIEFPFAGDRMSVMAEWWCPWWVAKNNSWAYQMLYGGVEMRVWLGDREQKPSLSGHFFGVYGGAGKFDLGYNNIGYQSKFYYTAGLTYGYSFPIHKSLRIETSLSLGYLNTRYEKYEVVEDGKILVWQHDGRFTWLGPTKLKVSFVWTIFNRNRR